ncbi:uncharacterized protein J3R85_015368 [Psidium guajava]|nr:uncharacterized protein J3R85_015368 [Psidium guajava]
MQRLNSVLRQGQKAIVDLGLLTVLRSEIAHELSSNRFQNDQIGDLGDFLVDWDAPESEDVLLRRKCESGEEVAVSALLGPQMYGKEGMFPREVLMKVCVKKPGLNSILQFDCDVCSGTDSGSEFHLRGAYYLPSPALWHRSLYKGPLFSTLDHDLQDKLKEYLVAKGIGRGLTDFLLLYMHRKEQNQYDIYSVSHLFHCFFLNSPIEVLNFLNQAAYAGSISSLPALIRLFCQLTEGSM